MKTQKAKQKFAALGAAIVGIVLGVQAEPTITDVKAQQRYPWNGKFDISYTASGVDEECRDRSVVPSLKVLAVEQTTHVTNVAEAAYLSGDTAMKNGAHKLVWDMDAQGIFQGLVSTNFEVFVSVEVVKAQGGVQLWKDGPYWAECNVGATKPEEYGYYFWWGDTVGYKRNANNDGCISVKDGTAFNFDGENCPTYGKDTATLTSEGYIDSTGNLSAAHDAATAYLGAPWRMPTLAEIDALISNCSTTYSTTNGVVGWLFTGKDDYASQSIFMPAAGTGFGGAGNCGNYWSSTHFSLSTSCSEELYLWPDQQIFSLPLVRYEGLSVRPLRGFAK